jgi:hypothetical protein
MSTKPRGYGGDTIVELSKGPALHLGTQSRWTLWIISSGSA